MEAILQYKVVMLNFPALKVIKCVLLVSFSHSLIILYFCLHHKLKQALNQQAEKIHAVTALHPPTVQVGSRAVGGVRLWTCLSPATPLLNPALALPKRLDPMEGSCPALSLCCHGCCYYLWWCYSASPSFQWHFQQAFIVNKPWYPFFCSILMLTCLPLFLPHCISASDCLGDVRFLAKVIRLAQNFFIPFTTSCLQCRLC